MVLQYDPKQQCLSSSAELPDSDDTPVDNELQNLVPNLLASTLALAWAAREDWFFGVDMGIYFAPSQSAIVPDGFLSLGVERFVDPPQGRLSYVLWEEDNSVPTLALEAVSKTYGGEYERRRNAMPIWVFATMRLPAKFEPSASAIALRRLSFGKWRVSIVGW